jgi:tRNA (mo5U34)-methyltransferase
MAQGTFAYVRGWRRQFEETSGWWHSFDLPDGTSIKGVTTVADMRERLGQFPIPDDLHGARVLDIGAWDGWFSFEMERRGAEVLAIDCWDNPRFHQIRRALKSRVEYRQMDVYELTPESVGRFDIVLFMGVLYHLKHPLLALERVCALTTGLAAVDSFVLQERHRPGENVENRPVMEFYESDEFGGQRDNWCGPSLPCLMAMCRTAGFARVEHRATLTNGACIACHRQWEPETITGQPPQLIDAYHHTNFGINFCTKYDEYITIFFRPPDGSEATIERTKTQVGEFGVRPYSLEKKWAGIWQANFKLPPGMTSGWHDVIVRIGGAASNPLRIAVDVPVPLLPIRIHGVRDGKTWEPGVLDPANGNVLSAWVSDLPENADRANVQAVLAGEQLPVQFISPFGTETRQVNIEIPGEAPRGELELQILIGENRTDPFPVQILQ